jgi:peptidoglycan/xylan/chitin deacetylase (PgdA/CDA1 family)
VELALTINGMIRSENGPEDDDVDYWCERENSRENFQKLLDALKQNDMPPTVDFVIGKQVDQALLERWLQSGNLVGNMTYSRAKARRRPEEFIANVTQNDDLLLTLWKKYPPKQKYFRYPRLKLSKDVQTRDLIKAAIKEKGYLEAPATIDPKDRKFSDLYCSAQARGDQDCINLARAQFKSLLLESTLRAREAARRRAGYDVKHILKLGANQFTCDNLADVLAYYKSLGVKFITLEEALRDPIYSAVDEKGRPAAAAIMRDSRPRQSGRN